VTPDPVARALVALDSYIDVTVEGLVANVDVLEADPADRPAGLRLQGHLLELERLLAVRNGLVERNG